MTSAPSQPDPIPAAQWRAASVRYPFAPRDAVGPVDLAVRQGERLLLLGPSGSGKSTLLLTLTGLIPRSVPAEVRGSVSLFGRDARERQPWAWAKDVAQYFQDADQTLCGMRVEDEIAFALENRALPPAEISARVRAAMERAGLPEGWLQRRSMTLSGGERQLVALAATLVQDAPLFVADEPTAHLAPQAAERLHRLLMQREKDRTVLIVDHRLDGPIGSIDRVAVLGPEGSILAEGEPRRLFREKRDLLRSHGIWRPAASDLDGALEAAGMTPVIPPLSVQEALAHLDPGTVPPAALAKARPAVEAFLASRRPEPAAPAGRAVAELRKADCAPYRGPVVLREIDLAIREGEILGILGANGAGKSTLGACLAGLLPLRGGTRRGAPGGLAFQRPENQFVAGTVADEILSSLPKRMAEGERRRRLDAVLAAWSLSGLERRHPFTLSQGQKRRLALASLTAADRWPLLVLDEPTAGLDAKGVAALAGQIAALGGEGRALAVVTHDMDLALRLCTRAIVIGDGRILAEGRPEDLLFDAALLACAGLAAPSCAPARLWLRRSAPC
ncbi:ABC transporter ATP-binding protein [Microvirga thermotolerans]|uniref:ATP-binding cassette domain-containing protein n=1 Tax=Microvirga thermotolerans TaxID=2651334 RepID=A0A5P9JXQ1_9HYPH|nr:ABC transporter ATP-binding protein [Microvirga thermotolerans]QFU16190.1 ATP-binding cassette domain-containing protein [Microvirga thermotolerans]